MPFDDDVALHNPGPFFRLLRPFAPHPMNATLPAVAPTLRFPSPESPAWGRSLEIVPGIRWLRMPLPFALDHINLWLLEDGDAWTQVDCGLGDDATRDWWERHFATTFGGARLERVVATHCHPDHIGNAAWLTARFDCPLVMPQAEYLTAHALANEHSGYGVEPTCALFRRHGLEPEHLAALRARGNQYRRGVPELPSHYQRLIAGDELTIGARRWRVIPGYGHSPEHAALYCSALGVLISGDMLLPKISTNVSVWPPEPESDPLARFLDSLDHFLRLPPDTLVLPSHGLPFSGIPIRIEQLRAHHAARLSELEAAAGTPVTAASVLPVLFRRALDPQQRFFAMGEAIAHLNHLWHTGRLRRQETDGSFRFVRA
jgi:glyoxylase-like metal-dependent hydrolase (beta-lactamase superfamily II)